VNPTELRLFGHRGAPAHAPENTVASFARALTDGATALETDVHATADGHFVTVHDPDGGRVAGDPRRIAELTLAEIQRWDLGDGERVPTLAQALVRFPGVPFSVDLKPDRPDLVAPLIECVRQCDAEHRVTLASFHDRLLWRVHSLGWQGPAALSRIEAAAIRLLPPIVARRVVRGSAAHVPQRVSVIRLDSEAFMRRCRRLGLRVEFWTVNDPAEARLLLARGATGIMTDDPAVIAPVFRECFD
jgi:glycerophosphoryl diester phosphodiesterase